MIAKRHVGNIGSSISSDKPWALLLSVPIVAFSSIVVTNPGTSLAAILKCGASVPIA